MRVRSLSDAVISGWLWWVTVRSLSDAVIVGDSGEWLCVRSLTQWLWVTLASECVFSLWRSDYGWLWRVTVRSLSDEVTVRSLWRSDCGWLCVLSLTQWLWVTGRWMCVLSLTRWLWVTVRSLSDAVGDCALSLWCGDCRWLAGDCAFSLWRGDCGWLWRVTVRNEIAMPD